MAKSGGRPSPRQLLHASVAAGVTSTSTAADGAALSTPLGGSFTIADLTTVRIKAHCGAVSNSGVTYCELIIMVDGVRQGSAIFWSLVGGVSGPMHAEVQVAGLSVGAHTVAVNMKVGATTGTCNLAPSVTVEEVAA